MNPEFNLSEAIQRNRDRAVRGEITSRLAVLGNDWLIRVDALSRLAGQSFNETVKSVPPIGIALLSLDEHVALEPNAVVRYAEELGDRLNDGGGWSEIIRGAIQRATLAGVFETGAQKEKLFAIADVLFQIRGPHRMDVAQQLCQRLEEIIPLSAE